MKIVAFLAASLLCVGIAGADEYAGPPGNYPAGPPAGILVPVAPMPMQAPAPRPRAELRAAVLAQFDRNGDGRLEPNERRHAMRALRKMTKKMARQERRAERRRMRGDNGF
jgi:hypothetical protein